MTELAIGQIWEDCDKRGYGRRLKIIALEHEPRYAELHALCEVLNGPGPSKRRTIIRADRFRPTATGYRLVEDAGAPTQ